MLRIYTRHDSDCAYKGDMYHRRCRCPKWVRGVLPNQGPVRQSARTRSWEQAERYARELEQENSVGRDQRIQTATIEQSSVLIAQEQTHSDSICTKNRSVPIRDAVESFLEDHAAQGNADDTTRKYRSLLQKAFVNWADDQRFKYLGALSPAHLTKFRSTWHRAGNSGSTICRKHEMMTTFFAFCVTQEFLKKNPMSALKKPKAPDIVPTDYFRPHEFEKIVAATCRYHYKGRDSKHRATRLQAFVLVMRWAGLSILDTVKLERKALSKSDEGDDHIFLYRSKTGVPVNVVIPPEIANLLRNLPNSNPKYFFWSGKGKPTTGKRAYFRSLQKLFTLADIKDEYGPKRCHPHMFRDTFAVELLLAGNPIDQVSLLLGHSSVKITERHYSPFCKARQLQLTCAVKKAWSGGAQTLANSRSSDSATSGDGGASTLMLQ